jgi:hypothetical protein
MSLTGQPVDGTYKSLTRINDNDNGIDSSLENITDGVGTSSAFNLSTNSALIKPTASDNTSAFVCQDKDGNSLLTVDTTNDKVKLGSGQQYANTSYAYFGISYIDTAGAAFLANTHYSIPFGGANYGDAVAANYALGTGTDPATSLTISDTAHSVVRCYWWVPDAIVIDEVKWLLGADAATGDTCRAHLMSYTVDTSNGTTGGDLSSGTVIASSSDITNSGYEQIYNNTMTVSSSSVSAGKVILFVFRSDSVNSDYTINATIKYHIV